MVQLEFLQFSEGRLREALLWVLKNECDGIAEETRDHDYQTRIDWLLRTFGDCDLSALCGRKGYEAMMRVYRDERAKPDGIKNITLRKRFKFLIRALKVAAARELLPGPVPKVPAMPNDDSPRTAYLTHAQYLKLRHALPTAWHRLYLDVGFWTGMHRRDIENTQREHLDPDRPVLDQAGKVVARGAYLLRNSKTRRHRPVWLPMHPEFRQCIAEYYADHAPAADDILVGKCWKPSQWLTPACRRAGIERICVANLRQSRAKFLEDNGADVGAIRYALGHIGLSTQLVTKHYLGTAPGPGSVKRLHETQTAAPDPRGTERKPAKAKRAIRKGPRSTSAHTQPQKIKSSRVRS